MKAKIRKAGIEALHNTKETCNVKGKLRFVQSKLGDLTNRLEQQESQWEQQQQEKSCWIEEKRCTLIVRQEMVAAYVVRQKEKHQLKSR